VTAPDRKPTWPCACGRGLNGAHECCCTGCLKAGRPAHFSSVSAFDLHWVGKGDGRHCVDPATLVRQDGSPRLSERPRASGQVWGYPTDREHPFAGQPTHARSPWAGPGFVGDPSVCAPGLCGCWDEP
jgi:hypothetical protein